MIANREQWRNSPQAGFRRYVRALVRQGPWSRAQREVVAAIVNLWFHHAGGEGVIRPSVAGLARRSKCSERSVNYALSDLRKSGIIKCVKHCHGGRNVCPHYVVNIATLIDVCGGEIPSETLQNLHPFLP